MGPDDRGTVIYTRDQVTKVLPRCCHPLTVYRFSTDFDPSREMVVTTRGRAVELPTTAGCLPVMAVWQKRAQTRGVRPTVLPGFGKTCPTLPGLTISRAIQPLAGRAGFVSFPARPLQFSGRLRLIARLGRTR